MLAAKYRPAGAAMAVALSGAEAVWAVAQAVVPTAACAGSSWSCSRSSQGTSSRLTTKPGVSMHSTGVLLSERANSIARPKSCGSVWSVLITSTSCMSCTGLKKCKPTICEGRPQ